MKKVAIIGLLFVTLNGYAKEFYEELSPTQRHELAQSYRKTGERFIELGQKSRGKYYLNLADKIDAAGSGSKSNKATNTAEELIVIIPDLENSEPLVEDEPQQEKADQAINSFDFLLDEPLIAHPIKPRNDLERYPSNLSAWPDLPTDPAEVSLALFNRYLVALVTEDIELMLSALAHTMALPGYEQGLNTAEQELFYRELFAAFQFDNIKIDEIYNVDSIEVKVLDEVRSMITIKALPKAPPALADWRYWDGFWGTTHHYFFEKINGKWGMIAFDIAFKE